MLSLNVNGPLSSDLIPCFFFLSKSYILQLKNSPSHYCQFCIPIHLQFPLLFVAYDFNKYEIRYQWVQEDYVSRLRTSLVQFLSNGTAKMKLAILAFLHCENFVKTSSAR